MTATQQLLAFAAAEHRLPIAVAAQARMLLADTLTVGIAGSTAPGADGVLAAALDWGRSGEARILGRSQRLPAPAAAFVNAFQIHGLEWDAVHEPAVVHAMSVVTAALLAVCDRRGGVDPDEALTALAVGVDIACGLGLSATSGLRFFRPATAGLIGAALACARIERLPTERFADVLGLAYSQCAGTMQAHVEGSVALPLQIAHAARAAITAVDLVTYGLSGPHDSLEGPFGYFGLFDDGSLDAYAAELGRRWRICEISVKPFPSGRASHATLSVLQALRTRADFAPCDVVTVTAHVPPLIARLVGRPWIDDMTTAYARLCLPLLSALMLVDGRIDPRRFTAATFADPMLRGLGERLTIVVDGNPDPNALAPQRIEVALIDGQRLLTEVPQTLGHPDNSLDETGHHAKRQLCLELAAEPLDAETAICLADRPELFLSGADL